MDGRINTALHLDAFNALRNVHDLEYEMRYSQT